MQYLELFNKMLDSNILRKALNEKNLELKEVATSYTGFINFKIDTYIRPRKMRGKRNNPYLGRIDSIEKTNNKYDIWINSTLINDEDIFNELIFKIIGELKEHDFSLIYLNDEDE